MWNNDVSWQDNDNTTMFLIETPKRESGLVKIISVNASLELHSGNVFDENLLSFKMNTEHERKIRLHTIYTYVQLRCLKTMWVVMILL